MRALFFELVQCLAPIPRQLVDAQMAALAVAHLVDVLVDRRSRVHLLLDAVRVRGVGVRG